MPLDGPSHVQKPMSDTRQYDPDRAFSAEFQKSITAARSVAVRKRVIAAKTRQPWTESITQEFIALLETGLQAHEAGAKMGITKWAARNKRDRLLREGKVAKRRPEWTEHQLSVLTAMSHAGAGNRKIAAATGKSMEAVREKLARLGEFGPEYRDEYEIHVKAHHAATDKLVALLAKHHPERRTHVSMDR